MLTTQYQAVKPSELLGNPKYSKANTPRYREYAHCESITSGMTLTSLNLPFKYYNSGWSGENKCTALANSDTQSAWIKLQEMVVL